MRRTRIRPVSKKRARENRERRQVVEAMAEGDPWCRKCREELAVDPHEVLSRARGGSITDPENIVPLCRTCHRWVTEHPIQAQAEGWLSPSKLPIREWEIQHD